ncbi:hypothetical protein DOZ52_13385 [Enterobacter hormaechei]|uniref:hypothetical protein n=1 Tax=Enterobacter hormaechei TaxID=158836 RepID=UPI000DBF5BDC|nr:hypothetical protein [Enterobacter hormaechei]RAM42235.1 hypothetical protein DOZ52_13385 [Enterobacter hormaechei]
MSNIDKQALTDEAISKAFAGTNFGRDDFKNILAETVIDTAAGWRCGFTATTICTQLGLLTPKGCASALGLRFISEHVQRETKRLKDELEAAEKRIAELSHHLQSAHAFIEHTEAFGYEASNGILCCGDAQWNIDASKSALAAADKGEAS